MTSSRMRQRTLLEFASSPPLTKRSANKRKMFTSSSSEDCHSDPGKIQFERKADSKDSDHTPSRQQTVDDEDIPPRRYARRTRKPQSAPMISVDTSSSEEETTLTKRPTPFKQSRHIVVSDDSDSQRLRKRRRLVKGRRPLKDPTIEEAEDDESLVDEVDEDSLCHSKCFPLICSNYLSSVILDSRLRDRSKKSTYAQNLERLRRG